MLATRLSDGFSSQICKKIVICFSTCLSHKKNSSNFNPKSTNILSDQGNVRRELNSSITFPFPWRMLNKKILINVTQVPIKSKRLKS